MSISVTRAVGCALFVLLTGAPFAAAQTIETYAGAKRFVDSPALGTPIIPGSSSMAPDGSVAVLNLFNGQVIRFDPVTSTTTTLPVPPNIYLWQYFDDVALDRFGHYYLLSARNTVYQGDPLTDDSQFVTGINWGMPYWSHCFGYSAWPASHLYVADITGGPANNVIVVDSGSSSVCLATVGGYSQMLAGNWEGNVGFGGDGGPAYEALLDHPQAAVTDDAGNVFIADTGNRRIRKVSAEDGIITTIAGTGLAGFNGDGIPALDANLSQPSALAIGPAGELYIYDAAEARVRRIDTSTGLITTAAGNGVAGVNGDGGAATAASLGDVSGLSISATGDLYISDASARRLRRVAANTGIISPILGNGEASFCGEAAPRLESCLLEPQGIALDAQGNLFVSDSGNGRIRKVDAATGSLTTLAGNGVHAGHGGDGGPASEASFGAEPGGLALDPAGNLYIAGGLDHRVRRIDAATGFISTIAGTGTAGFAGDGGSASLAQLDNPTDLAFDAAGNLYVSDAGNHRVRRIAAGTGVITTIAGNGLTTGPLGDGGPATSARLGKPGTLALDTQGNLLIVDDELLRLRKVDVASGNISAVAGNGSTTSSGDNGPAVDAGLGTNPQIAVKSNGNILVTSGYWLRQINVATGKIEMLSVYGMWTEDGQSLQHPSASVLAPDGHLYVADTAQHRVFRIADIPAQPPDTTPPDINPVLEGTLGANGWYTSNVRVLFYVTESESSTQYSPGCNVVTVSQDTPGTTFTCTATSGGGSTTRSLTVKRDATPPTLSFGAPSPAADAGGWHNSAVAIPYTTADATSGVVSANPAAPLVFELDGTGQFAQVQVRDAAGNIAVFESPHVNIDRTPPVIQPVVTGTLGANNWYTSDVHVNWTIGEMPGSLGGTTSCQEAMVTTDTAGVTFGCTVSSAGGSASSSITIKRDATPPDLAFGTPSPVPNANGWNKTNVSIPFTRSDALSGIATTSVTSPLVLSTEGAAVTGQVVVSDNAGNSATFTSIPRNIDKTPPVIEYASPAEGATYGFYQDVVADYSCNDVSLLSCTAPTPNGELINTRTAGPRTFKVTAKDSVAFTTAVTHAFTVEPTFNFEGFIGGANEPPTLNLVSRGSLVPIRWRLPDGRGGFVTNPASFSSATVGSLTCGSAPVVALNDTASGPAGISFDPATSTFTYNWQTSTSWTGCRKLTIKLKDNSLHELRFKFQ